MNAKKLALLLGCDWSWITLNCFCSLIGRVGWFLVCVIELLLWQRRNSNRVASEPRRSRKEADLGMSQDHSLLGSPNNQQKTRVFMCRSVPRAGHRAEGVWGFFSQGFWASQIPNRVLGVHSEPSQGTCAASSDRRQKGQTCRAPSALLPRACPAKPFCLGCIRCTTRQHSPAAGKSGEEKLGSPNTILQHSRRLHTAEVWSQARNARCRGG